MSIRNIFNRHSRLHAAANAYADGELRGAELSNFEGHFAGCERCRQTVAGTLALKAALREMPAAIPPRAFTITPAMLQSAPPAPRAVHGGTPLYLGLARAGAALSVAAFAMTLAFGALDSDTSNGDDDSAGTAARDLETAEYAAPAAAPEKSQDSAALVDSLTATVTPMLAPSGPGGATGSGLATPVPPSTGIATPEVRTGGANGAADVPSPAAGGSVVVQAAPDSASGGETSSLGPPATLDADAETDDGGPNATAWLGALAVAAVVVLGGLEVNRRLRSR